MYPRIYALVREVPPGLVTTYGEVGRAAGCTARTVGFAMAALKPGSDVPWQRVINAKGQVSPRQDGEGNILQRDLLEAERVDFSAAGSIDLEKHGYRFARD